MPAPFRARFAAMADAMPRTMGPITRSSVQMAATPMVPAPMKRIFWRNTVPTKSASSVPTGGPPVGELGEKDAEANHDADEHGNAHRDAHQMAHSDERERQAAEQHRASGPDLEHPANFLGREFHLGEERIERGKQAARSHSGEALAVFLFSANASADLQHFGCGDAFRIGKVRSRNQSTAQRHRIHHAKHAADRNDRDRLPIGESRPTIPP